MSAKRDDFARIQEIYDALVRACRAYCDDRGYELM